MCLFHLPFPLVGTLEIVFWMAEKQGGEGLWIHIRLGGIKKSSSVKLLGCRDSLVTIEPSLFWSVQWDCIDIVTIVQTLSSILFNTIADHVPG